LTIPILHNATVIQSFVDAFSSTFASLDWHWHSFNLIEPLCEAILNTSTITRIKFSGYQLYTFARLYSFLTQARYILKRWTWSKSKWMTVGVGSSWIWAMGFGRTRKGGMPSCMELHSQWRPKEFIKCNCAVTTVHAHINKLYPDWPYGLRHSRANLLLAMADLRRCSGQVFT